MRTMRMIVSSAAISTSLLIPLQVLAQKPVDSDKTDTTAKLETVVVTAQFRETNLQDTPIAITALTGAVLDERGITNIADVAKVAPNVNISATSAVHGPAAAIYIRGIGQFDSNMAFEPGVGVYIDDVYHGTMNGNMMDLLDLDRVEVLRGPQGTLAGKNSIGGAVKLYSRKPVGDGKGYAEFTIGDDNKRVIRAAYDIPLVDNALFLRVSGMSNKQDGYITLIDYACANPGTISTPIRSVRADCKTGTLGGKDVSGFRGALRWLASDNVEINLNADYLKDNSEMNAFTQVKTPDVRFIPSNPFINYSSFVDPFTGEVYPNVSSADTRGAGLTVDWKFADKLSFKSITSYRELLAQYSNDQDGSPLGDRLNYNEQNFHQFSQELRLSGASFNDAIDWTVGAYYYDSKGSLANRIASGAFFNFLNDDDVDSSSKSGFGHLVWHATDRMNLTGGVRYTKDEKSYLFRQVAADRVTPTPQNGRTAEYKGNHTDYRLGIDYRWNESLMTYFQFSTGYKGGGTNPRPVGLTQILPFNPEFLDAYEIGLKSDLFDRTMRLNLSAFFNKYTDIILTNTAACCGPGGAPFAILPYNAGDADIKGVEAELEWEPIKHLSITASGSLLDFKYTRIATSSTVLIDTPKDGITPYTAKHNWALGVSYAIPLESGATITPRVDAANTGSKYSEPHNRPDSYIAGYTMLNARLAWASANKDWEATVGVNNLTDKTYYTAAFDAMAFSGTLQHALARKREASLTLRRNF